MGFVVVVVVSARSLLHIVLLKLKYKCAKLRRRFISHFLAIILNKLITLLGII
jgi:hypothetical protein